MPIYEYRCEDCGTKFEKLVRRAPDESELACPSCGRKRLTTELSVFAAHARGGKPDGPMCPSGGVCPTPERCGLN